MPVSYLPCITSLVLIGVPFLFLIQGRKHFLIAAGVAASLLAAFLLWIYVPGWILMARAYNGDPVAQYEFARWTEKHCEQINAVVLCPCNPNVLGGYRWLEKAASQDYPPAVWLVGVRLKYGIHVPRPPNWQGPGGNVFPQPQRGQVMIDRAVQQLAFQPSADEQVYYFQVYRK